MLSTLGEIFAADQVGFPVLSYTVFIPLVAAVLLAFSKNEKQIKKIALMATLTSFLLSTLLLLFFREGTPDMQFVERMAWIAPLGITYHVGVDGVSVLLVVLTTFLSVLTLLFSWKGIDHYFKEYVICLLVLETTVIGVFCALDLFLFFLLWEIMLLPMYFLIKTWGGARRNYASLKFVLYTLLGSVLMLVGFVILYLNHQSVTGTYSFDLLDLLKAPLTQTQQMWVFTLLFFGFAFKVPMFPFHTWLPDAHVEAPTTGSVLLAGVLLKMGTYGFVRFSLPLLPEASAYFVPLMSILGVIGIIYGALLALAQDDIKKLIAYSSISHLGFVILGIFALNAQGIQGGIIQMINHGISTSGLFFIVGFLYNRRHTRDIKEYGGLAKQVPILAGFYLVISMSSLAFPGTNGFVGELLILLGAMKSNWQIAAPAFVGVLLAGAYLLWLYQRTMMGELDNPKNKNLLDLDRIEIGICTALVVVILWMGIYPFPFLRMMEDSVTFITDRMATVQKTADRPATGAPLVQSTLNIEPQ